MRIIKFLKLSYR